MASAPVRLLIRTPPFPPDGGGTRLTVAADAPMMDARRAIAEAVAAARALPAGEAAAPQTLRLVAGGRLLGASGTLAEALSTVRWGRRKGMGECGCMR
jgi:hypothetical protein